MTIYVVQWNYSSSLAGPFIKGQEVELEDEFAKRINVDSPGVLKAAAKRQDRQVKSAKTKED